MVNTPRVVLSQVTSDTTQNPTTDQLYETYLARKGVRKDDILFNTGVLWQSVAQDVSFIEAIRDANISPMSRVLDVGCGAGGSILRLLRIGFSSDAITGIDIQAKRIEEARHKLPGISFFCVDATSIPFPDRSFDLVTESTMFILMADDSESRTVADEMMRVTAPGGYIVLTDWSAKLPWQKQYCPLTHRRIRNLFPDTSVILSRRGALAPPLGRWLSSHAPGLYFPIAELLFFARVQRTTILRKHIH